VGVEKLKLKRNHTWKSKPGYSICVIDRGAVRFDYPGNWIVEPGEGAVHLHDRSPSVESCDLGVSIFRVPGDYVQELSLDDMLLDTLRGEREPYQQSEVFHIQRPDLEVAWLEQRYIDADYKRDARFRVALARGPALCLITMNYWSSRAAGLERVWDEVLRTLVLGLHVEDPTSGPVIQ
jgi:hypothetical protein